MALEKGTTLAGYRIEGILGQGGMGVVYEATQLSLKRTVALKILAPHLSEDVLFRERFRREGQIQAGIDHAHIVTVHEAGETEHGFFIAMRLIRGPNLKNLIVDRKLDPGRTLRILGPIADALDTAHEAGLIHRDVKPQNILVGGRDQGFLADFGLTKAPGEESLTKTGQFVGTFDYISPEQIKGERATVRSDVYALAAVLYECFTGAVPYPKDSDAATLYAHVSDPPPKVTGQRPELPGGLDEVIATGMAKDPAERYASASELLRETNERFDRSARPAFTPPGRPEPAQADRSGRNRAGGRTERSAAQRRPRREAATPAGGRPGGDRSPPGRCSLAVVALGFVVGHSSGGSERPRPAADRVAKAGALRLSFPDAWRRAPDPPAVPGLKLKDPIALSQRGRPTRGPDRRHDGRDGSCAAAAGARRPARAPPCAKRCREAGRARRLPLRGTAARGLQRPPDPLRGAHHRGSGHGRLRVHGRRRGRVPSQVRERRRWAEADPRQGVRPRRGPALPGQARQGDGAAQHRPQAGRPPATHGEEAGRPGERRRLPCEGLPPRPAIAGWTCRQPRGA